MKIGSLFDSRLLGDFPLLRLPVRIDVAQFDLIRIFDFFSISVISLNWLDQYWLSPLLGVLLNLIDRNGVKFF